jgi:hypothetical protein
VDGKSFPVCKKHHTKAWTLFMKDGWLYAVNVNAKKMTGRPVTAISLPCGFDAVRRF